VMLTICDTHVLLFWADRKDRLSLTASNALNAGLVAKNLACSDVSFWEISVLVRKDRLKLPPDCSPASYMDDIVRSLRLTVLPITPSIAALAESGIVPHGDPADRLIAATALHHHIPLITTDAKLHALPSLHCIW